MIVPFVSLDALHAPLIDAVLADMRELIKTGTFTNGPAVEEFEGEFARYCGREHCAGVANGLDALRFALLARDIGPGDDVLVPAATFVATFEAVSQTGATVVPVDISDDDYCIDGDALAATVGPGTRAVVPVHLYGQLADMRAVAAAARSADIVEDAAQAHGATRDGKGAGQTGIAAAFSFYPAKNLGAFGDAGALVCDDAEVAARVRSLREHGQREKYRHSAIGYTSRLDTLQALVLLRKLPHLQGWNDERRMVAARYSDALADVGDLRLPPVAAGSEPVWHLYVVRTAAPDALATFLRERGVATARHYPEPPHLSPAYEHLGYEKGAFPVAEALSRECLSLPLFAGITEEQQERVVEAVRAYF
jgi:dTDP-4-amino-4,6-dideoxygalactose transaminase